MPKLGLYHDADPILLTSVSGSLTRAPSGKLHVRKDNLAAVTAPGVTDDSAAGYEVGSTWLDTSGGNFYVCKAAAEGAASWMATVQSPVAPAGSGTELQYRNGSSFGAITGSSWSGSILDLPSGTTLNGTAVSVSGHTHSYEPVISAGTTAQYWRGDKSWQTLDKSAVGLGSVENTALSSWAGSANVTMLGTITTGTWNAGAVTIPLGSATAPSLTFTGDTNTGIYSTGSDKVSIGTGGVQRVAIDGNGVGIGTTPLNNLHVKAANPTLNLHTTGNNTGNTIINFMHYGDSNSKMTAIAAVPINYYGQANLYFVVRGATTADYDIVADAKLTLTPSSGATFSCPLHVDGNLDLYKSGVGEYYLTWADTNNSLIAGSTGMFFRNYSGQFKFVDTNTGGHPTTIQFFNNTTQFLDVTNDISTFSSSVVSNGYIGCYAYGHRIWVGSSSLVYMTSVSISTGAGMKLYGDYGFELHTGTKKVMDFDQGGSATFYGPIYATPTAVAGGRAAPLFITNASTVNGSSAGIKFSVTSAGASPTTPGIWLECVRPSAGSASTQFVVTRQIDGNPGTILITADGGAFTVTTPVVIPLGTVAAPSLVFSGDTDTGIYSPGADKVAISTGGAARLTLASTSSTFTTDVNTASDKAYYLGDPTTDGSWRLVRSGDNLVAERRESGSYVTKQTISA